MFKPLKKLFKRKKGKSTQRPGGAAAGGSSSRSADRGSSERNQQQQQQHEEESSKTLAAADDPQGSTTSEKGEQDQSRGDSKPKAASPSSTPNNNNNLTTSSPPAANSDLVARVPTTSISAPSQVSLQVPSHPVEDSKRSDATSAVPPKAAVGKEDQSDARASESEKDRIVSAGIASSSAPHPDTTTTAAEEIEKDKTPSAQIASSTASSPDNSGGDRPVAEISFQNSIASEKDEETKPQTGEGAESKATTAPSSPIKPASRTSRKMSRNFGPESPTPSIKRAVQAAAAASTDNDVMTEQQKTEDAIRNLLETNVYAEGELIDSPRIVKAYESIPLLETNRLPRGGVSFNTKAVGRIQYGIPPETIKDSMQLGLPVPQVYIVPVERFCREMGPALGVNLAEFEFPAYFNFFVYKKRCTLVVDSSDAEENIRRVFSETLLGPEQFRREKNPIQYEEEDFAPSYPREAIPNFPKELQHFRIMPDGKELVIETLLEFRHFESRTEGHHNVGVPPTLEDDGGGEEVESPKAETSEKETLNEEKSKDKAETQSTDTDDDEGQDEFDDEDIGKDPSEVGSRTDLSPWTYSQARFMGDVSTIWPTTATPEQIQARNVPRVEIFKMPGGTEYIIHDVDENNIIIGKARVSGHVKVSERMSVDGFGGHSILDDLLDDIKAPVSMKKEKMKLMKEIAAVSVRRCTPEIPLKTFYPPSFGVTVLGNSHGFDKSGSVSGYVLWVNGRGVMIDPPPYSSATLEREGIRPRMIVAIILTHCHADHDAGAFQKVLTGSPVVVITTPTIYKSFIRKYAALSALNPVLLRHSHRYKQAIIGEPLRFQGATFHFMYTLHTIPCVGFRVEWRGRSMVFTGDHFNNPEALEVLREKGVLSKARADDLNNLPLQDTDLLLHEAGAPPIHTPLAVLMKLPEKVKKHTYVVHTSALPPDCDLKVAPTGTAGTIRLDELKKPKSRSIPRDSDRSIQRGGSSDLVEMGGAWNTQNEYDLNVQEKPDEPDLSSAQLMQTSFANLSLVQAPASSNTLGGLEVSTKTPGPIPLVSMRPASSTDAWFILNLLSAVPFLSSLSYSSTMAVLETAKVDAYAMDSVIIPAARRSNVLCVIWEGTCTERKSLSTKGSAHSKKITLGPISETSEDVAVWHAGDWTGPLALQPDKRLSGDSDTSRSHDVVALSPEGVKVITVEFSSLHAILKRGSALYLRYLERKAHQERVRLDSANDQLSNASDHVIEDAMKNLNVLDLINCNSALRKLNAVQKRHLESLAEGPVSFSPGERIWRAGASVDKAFIIVSGTASFVPKRRNAGSASGGQAKEPGQDKVGDAAAGESMKVDAIKAIKELGAKAREPANEESSVSSVEFDDGSKPSGQPIPYDALFSKHTHSMQEHNEYIKLSRGLQKRADFLQNEGSTEGLSGEEDADARNESQLDYTFTDDADPGSRSNRTSVIRRRSSRARYANKVLGRLYTRRAFSGGLVFSRGHFLGDVSKMVAGLLSTDGTSSVANADDYGASYGFGDKESESENQLESLAELVIHEQESDQNIMHNSTLTAGRDGCIALIFPKSALIPFLDEYPGLLLSLLGTQVVV